MPGYEKFRLKSEDELVSLINGKHRGGASADGFAVLACNKCFKAFTAQSTPEPETEQFTALMHRLGKSVVYCENIDFLCNEHRLMDIVTPQILQPGNSLPGAVFIIACGIGMQTAANIIYDSAPGIPVYTACDSIDSGGGHGMSLTDKRCGACMQCYLNQTGGICPVTGCYKSLLNGPCGGAKDGKCEADKSFDCAWETILLRGSLTQLHGTEDSLHELVSRSDCLSEAINSRNYNIANKKELDEIAEHTENKRKESFYGGVYLRYSKDSTAFLTLRNFPLPQRVSIPMLQHSGSSAEPIVCVGEHVKVGQKIGEAVGVVSSSVHASISGTISAITLRSHPNFNDDAFFITIESDGKDERHNSVTPIPYWDDLDILDIDAIIAEKGIVGMGGAGFPTPLKLKVKNPIDTILINGCESEPYITADHRIMLEYADDIINGLQIILKATGAKRGIIVISDNKSDAVAHLEAKTAAFDDIFVMALWSKYPQGAERMLVMRTLGRKLQYGQRPYDAGAIVINVSTARSIGDAFTSGMPLIERAVTATGSGLKNPGNYMVRIGTSVADILKYCGAEKNGGSKTVTMGGPMMGTRIKDYDIPVIKGTNAIIFKDEPLLRSGDCIRCGRCVDVCPMELLPLYFPVYKAREDWLSAGGGAVRRGELNAANCIECGACNYICPAGIDIRGAIRVCKGRVMS